MSPVAWTVTMAVLGMEKSEGLDPGVMTTLAVLVCLSSPKVVVGEVSVGGAEGSCRSV